MRATRFSLALLLVCAAGCRWTLRPPDASAQQNASDASDADDASDASASPACVGDPPSPPSDRDERGPLVHERTLVRPTSADIGRGACLGDVDNDGHVELLVLRADPFVALYDPRTLCARGTIAVPPYGRACIVDDLDGDGSPELALAHSVRFGARMRERYDERTMDSVTVGHLGISQTDRRTITWTWPQSWALAEERHVRGVGHVLATLDLDRDGRRELAVAGTVTEETPYQNAFVRAWEWAPEGCIGERACPQSVFDNTFFDTLDTNDLFVASVDDDSEPELAFDFGCQGGGLASVDRWDARPVLRASIGHPAHGAFADLDGDDRLDFLAPITPRCGGGAPTALRWLEPIDGAYRYLSDARNPHFEGPAQVMVATPDVLGDRRPEAFVCTRSIEATASHPVRCDLYSFDRAHIDRIWSWIEPESHPDMISRMLVIDVDHDTIDDVLVVTQSRVHLFRGQR